MSRERVCHAIPLVLGNYTTLWELLCQEETLTTDSWLHALRSDLVWVGRWAKGLCYSTTFVDFSGEEVAVWLSEHLSVLRRELRAAVAEQGRALHEWHAFQLCERKAGRFHGVSWTHTATGSSLQLPCPECSQLFANGSHLMTHAAQCHSHICPSRKYATGSKCPHCLKQFWTVERLRRHLASGPESRDQDKRDCTHGGS